MSDFYETLMSTLRQPRLAPQKAPPLAMPAEATAPSDRQPRYKTILHAVSAKHAVSVVDMRGPSRLKRVAAARFEAAYKLRVELELSFTKIGQILGGRHHTSIMHAVEQHTQRLDRAEAQP